MDNSNSLSNSILQSSESSLPAYNTTSYSSTDEGGFFDGLANITFSTWLIIILILAFLGFNIFAYLARGTQDVTSFFAPLMQKLFGTTATVAGQTVNVAAEGAKAVVGGTANVLDTGLTAVQEITPNGAPSSLKTQSVQGTMPQQDVTANNALNRALNTSQQTQQGGANDEYEAHEAPSSVHSAGKAGWCFVGEDRGFRTCAEVGVNDECMSGDIFPSQELCVNPNLRA
jgi:hypothetical protein